MLSIDPYMLEKKLGSGNFGNVYYTSKKGTEKIFATKKIEKKMVDKGVMKTYFLNEIDVLKSTDHENLIKLYEVKSSKNNFYMIMEYLNGGSLAEAYMKYFSMHKKPFPEAYVQHFLREMAKGIYYLHKNEIIHRDLKLENILFHFEKEEDLNNFNLLNSKVKIIDFGFAKFLKCQDADSICGSPINMDPSILKALAFKGNDVSVKYNLKADIWSLGIMVYFLLIGNQPFAGKSFSELFKKIDMGNYKIPKNLKLSKQAISVINGLLMFESEDRLSAFDLLYHEFLTKKVEDFDYIDLNMKTDLNSNNDQDIIMNNKNDINKIWGHYSAANNENISNIKTELVNESFLVELPKRNDYNTHTKILNNNNNMTSNYNQNQNQITQNRNIANNPGNVPNTITTQNASKNENKINSNNLNQIPPASYKVNSFKVNDLNGLNNIANNNPTGNTAGINSTNSTTNQANNNNYFNETKSPTPTTTINTNPNINQINNNNYKENITYTTSASVPSQNLAANNTVTITTTGNNINNNINTNSSNNNKVEYKISPEIKQTKSQPIITKPAVVNNTVNVTNFANTNTNNINTNKANTEVENLGGNLTKISINNNTNNLGVSSSNNNNNNYKLIKNEGNTYTKIDPNNTNKNITQTLINNPITSNINTGSTSNLNTTSYQINSNSNNIQMPKANSHTKIVSIGNSTPTSFTERKIISYENNNNEDEIISRKRVNTVYNQKPNDEEILNDSRKRMNTVYNPKSARKVQQNKSVRISETEVSELRANADISKTIKEPLNTINSTGNVSNFANYSVNQNPQNQNSNTPHDGRKYMLENYNNHIQGQTYSNYSNEANNYANSNTNTTRPRSISHNVKPINNDTKTTVTQEYKISSNNLNNPPMKISSSNVYINQNYTPTTTYSQTEGNEKITYNIPNSNTNSNMTYSNNNIANVTYIPKSSTSTTTIPQNISSNNVTYSYPQRSSNSEVHNVSYSNPPSSTAVDSSKNVTYTYPATQRNSNEQITSNIQSNNITYSYPQRSSNNSNIISANVEQNNSNYSIPQKRLSNESHQNVTYNYSGNINTVTHTQIPTSTSNIHIANQPGTTYTYVENNNNYQPTVNQFQKPVSSTNVNVTNYEYQPQGQNTTYRANSNNYISKDNQYSYK